MRGVRVFVFFFQAEDGIRDIGVAEVQTCALPISRTRRAPPSAYSPLIETASGSITSPWATSTAGPGIGKAVGRGREEVLVAPRRLKEINLRNTQPPVFDTSEQLRLSTQCIRTYAA